MDITQHRNYLFVKSLPEEEEEAACSQEFYQLEMKSSQSPSIRHHRQYSGTFKTQIHPAQLHGCGAWTLCAIAP